MNKIAILIGVLLASLNVYADQASVDINNNWEIVNKKNVYTKLKRTEMIVSRNKSLSFESFKLEAQHKRAELYQKAIDTKSVDDMRKFVDFSNALLASIYVFEILAADGRHCMGSDIDYIESPVGKCNNLPSYEKSTKYAKAHMVSMIADNSATNRSDTNA